MRPFRHIFFGRSWPAAIAAALVLAYVFLLPTGLFERASYSTTLLTEKGELLGARLAADEQWRFPLADSVPAKFRAAILQQEDRYFPYHPGFNPLSLARAAWLNMKEGRVVSGGSTVTMQLIRLNRGNPPRTLAEKAREILLATRIELACSKEEILRHYATHAPFGGNIVGFETAAWRYFKRAPAQLSWAESATLAVLPNAPGLIHPGRNRRALRDKRDELLGKLLRAGKIDSQSYALALLEEVPQQPSPLPDLSPHLTELLHARAPGQRHFTGLDAGLQARATEAVERQLAKLRRNKIQNGALLLIDNRTGAVRAYVGNSDGEARHNDMLRTPRSSGSILKPFLYAAMLQSGELLPSQLLPDIPTFIGSFGPQNFIDAYDGAVPADEALARSLNIPAVHALQRHSVPRFLHLLRRLGFSTVDRSADHYGLTLILGGAEVTPWELGQAYYRLAALLQRPAAHKGNDISLPAIHLTADDGVLSGHPLRPGAVYQTFEAMQTLVRPGSEAGWQAFGRADIAWKTGTSFGFRDAWAVGITPAYTCVVWVGNATGEGRPGLIGAEAAGPLLFDFMNSLPGTDWFAQPLSDFKPKDICAASGMLAGAQCADAQSRLVPRATGAHDVCTYCRSIFTDPSGSYRLSRSCASPSEMVRQNRFVLPPVMAWYYTQNHPSYRPLPPWRPGCGREDAQVVEVIYPGEGHRVFIPRELGGQKGKVIVELAHRDRARTLYWHLNGEYLGATETFHQKALDLEAGEYSLLVTDAAGNTTRRHFAVVE